MKQYTAKPFIKWVGGKGQLVKTFESLLPNGFSNIEDITYIEPFIGGGAMLFFMLQKFSNIKKAIINDVNPNLIKAYKAVKHTPESLIQSLLAIQKEYLNISEEDKRKEFYLTIRKRFNEGHLSDIDNTIYFIFLNRTCFNGLYRVNSKGEFNVPFGKYSNPTICHTSTLYADSELLQKVEIISGDFEETEKYVSGNTFVYFDPPYRPLDTTSSFNSYAKETFDDNEQIRLKKYVDKLTSKQCLIMLSNSDGKGRNPKDIFFDELFEDYIIERVYASRSVNSDPEKRGKLTELLIRNYKDTQQAVPKTSQQLLLDFNRCAHEQSTYRRTI
ncbi:MAG: DNA adenine methylase [Bacteroides sp.]